MTISRGQFRPGTVLALTMNYYDYYTSGGSWDLANTRNILFYETGAERVNNLASDTFVPGAVADHLTSAGGVLINGGQMSILRWLEAGALQVMAR